MPKRTKQQFDPNGTTTSNDASTPPPRTPSAGRSRRSTRTKAVSNAATANEAIQTPDEHEIREHAYRLYLERGGGPGSELDDWVRAERELKLKRVKS